MQTWLRERSCDLYLSFFLYKNWTRDCPGGPAVEHLPCNAGDEGSIPGRGTKTPHAMQGVAKKKTAVVTTLQFSKNKCVDHLLLLYYTGKLEDFSTK